MSNATANPRPAHRLYGRRDHELAGIRKVNICHAVIKANEPLRVGATGIYLHGNGYATCITVRDPAGNTVFTDDIPFSPRDADLT